MSATGVIGLLAACCSTAAFVPQVVKTWRTRSAGDISLAMFATVLSGSVLWIVYAFLQQDLPVGATNAIILLLSSAMPYLKLRYG